MRLLLEHVNSIYARIDQEVKAFQLKSGLRCPSGCGACCPTADVHTTILEMLPAANEVLCRGASAGWLDRIDSQAATATCVFYRRHRQPDEPGHCDFYGFRPAVCRLFGFASTRSRAGVRALVVCRQVKTADPAAAAAARAHQDAAPCFPDIGAELSALDISIGVRLMPINEALRRAILRLGLTMQMAQSERLGAISAA